MKVSSRRSQIIFHYNPTNRIGQCFSRALICAFCFFAGSSAADYPRSFEKISLVRTHIAESIGNKSVRAFLADSNGNTWVGTQSGLHLFDDSSDNRERDLNDLPPALAHSDVVDIVEAPSSIVLILTNSSRLFAYNAHQDKFTEHPAQRGANSGDPRSLYVAESGEVWIRYQHELSYAHDISSTGLADQPPFHVNVSLVSDVIRTKTGDVCGLEARAVVCGLTLHHGVKKIRLDSTLNAPILASTYDTDEGQFVVVLADSSVHRLTIHGTSSPIAKSLDGISQVSVTVMLVRDGLIYFGTDAGVFSLSLNSPGLRKAFIGRNSDVNSLHDGRHGVWVLSHSGLSLITQTGFRTWPTDDDNRAANVNSLASDGNGTIFLATDEGLIFVDEETLSTIWRSQLDTPDLLIDRRVMAVAYQNSRLYIGFWSKGLQVIQLEKDGRHLSAGTPLEETGVTLIEEVGTNILIGTSTKGLWILEPIDGSMTQLELAHFDDSPITGIARVDAGRLIVTSENAIYTLCTGNTTEICGSQTLPPISGHIPRIVSIHVDREGSAWIGTLNFGVFTGSLGENGIKVGTFTRSIDALQNLSIFGFEQTFQNELWLSTNSGLWKFDKKLRRVKRVQTLPVHATENFNHGASLAIGRNRLYFGTALGLLGIDLDFKHEELRSSKIYVKRVTVEGQQHRSSRFTDDKFRIELPFSSPNLRVGLSVNDFRDPLLNRYKYFLEGHSRGWTDMGNSNLVTVDQLEPGSYTLFAKGADASGVWSENTLKIPVSVQTPPWLSWYAYLCYAGAALLAANTARSLYERFVVSTRIKKQVMHEAAAHQQLVDDYQELADELDRVNAKHNRGVSEIMGTLRSIVESQEPSGSRTAMASSQNFGAYLDCVTAVHSVQRSYTGSQNIELTTLLNQIIDVLYAQREESRHAVVVNNTAGLSVRQQHAQIVGVTVFEALCHAIDEACTTSSFGALIQVDSEPVSLNDIESYCYAIRIIGARPIKWPTSLDSLRAPFTLQLLEAGLLRLADSEDDSEAVILSFFLSD